MRRVRTVLFVLVALAVGSAPTAAPAPLAGPPPLAISLSGSDTGSCSELQPCATFDRAYRVAQPGQTVLIAAGSYSTQEIDVDPAKANATAPVVFRPAAGAAVEIAGDLLILGASELEFQGLRLREYAVVPSTRDVVDSTTQYARNVTFRDVSAKVFYLRAAREIRILGGDIGGYSYAEFSATPTIGSYAGQPPSEDVLIERVLFHDMIRGGDRSDHAECLFIQNVDGLVIRSSRFRTCPIFGIFSQAVGNPMNARNVTIENNWIGHPRDGGNSAIDIDSRVGQSPPQHWLIRNNSLAGSLLLDGEAGYSGVVIEANLGPNSSAASCRVDPGVVYRRNLWTAVRCDPSDRIAALPYVDPQGFDFHLLRGSPAAGLAEPGQAPRTDIDGDIRPLAVGADAGADQRETALVERGRSIGRVRLGMQRRTVVAFYGAPAATARRGRGQLVTYRAHGGQLRVSYVLDTVVGVSTSSLYYRDSAGAGVGTPPPPRAPWLACLRAFRVLSGARATLYLPARGQRGASIATVSVVGRAGAACARR
jgi:hypothetical protein